MLASILTLAAIGVVFVILGWPKVSKARLWHATITPLASIIGSGFLVIGPILDHAFGGYAPIAMLALCALAYLFGAAIRENIRSHDAISDMPVSVDILETISSWVLAAAYIISVCYYLNLFGSFALRMTNVDTATNERILTTAIMLIVLAVGWVRGFKALERMEQVSVTVKLAIIGGLLMGLVLHTGKLGISDGLVFNPADYSIPKGILLVFGLMVTVQGFETSRYLGNQYSADVRVRSMRLSQLIASGIYMVYILLLSYAFQPDDIKLDETAIIDLMHLVTPILPALLIAAALAAQFSAAIADTGGCGGLINELTHRKVLPKQAYAIIILAGIALTWAANIFEIISYASRAFALYYAIQAAITTRLAWRNRQSLKPALYGALTLLGIAIVFLGEAVE